jgi:hypothetical protein
MGDRGRRARGDALKMSHGGGRGRNSVVAAQPELRSDVYYPCLTLLRSPRRGIFCASLQEARRRALRRTYRSTPEGEQAIRRAAGAPSDILDWDGSRGRTSKTPPPLAIPSESPTACRRRW